ncbi:MAG: hypothetical protein M9894_03350 [Planctomycetes bacterium]|nr:hypothetical protein [Planctomycetota bacterium]
MDDRLRGLRRRVGRGEAGARAALLAERLRSGDLAPERVRLAAALWDPDARAVSPVPQRLHEATALEPYGRAAVERACIATVRLLVPCWVEAFPDDERIPLAVLASERLALMPPEARGWEDGLRHVGMAEHDAARALEAGYQSAQALAAVAVDYTHAGVVHGNMGVEVVAGYALESLTAGPGRTEPDARRLVHEAIAADLVAWVLGEGDPLRERVEAGGR